MKIVVVGKSAVFILTKEEADAKFLPIKGFGELTMLILVAVTAMLPTMERDSKTICQEIITLRLDADVTDQERSDETVRLLSEYLEALRIELQKALETKAFSLVCSGCDTDGPETYDKAIAEGWTEVAPDDGMSWNFLGYCPNCTQSEAE